MNAHFLRGSAAAAALLLSACSTGFGATGSRSGPVDVTRFHLNQPVARGTIAVEPVEAADANTPDFWRYRAAAEAQLRRLGWTVVNPAGRSEQVALIDVEQGTRAALARRAPISAALGRSTGTGSSELVITLLEVSIRRRSDASVFWEGRAETEGRAGTVAADSRYVIDRLAEALFRDFPGESGRTIRLP